jgi:HSP20 family protein
MLEAFGVRLSGERVVGAPRVLARWVMMYATRLTTRVFSFRDEIDRLIENAAARNHVAYSDWNPAVDVTETSEALTFAVEIPGLTENDVDVSAENGILSIRGARGVTWKDEEDGRFHLAERRYGTFLRRFQLPPGIDTTKIEATVECGLLEVRVPSAALPQPTRIHIQAAAESNAAVPSAPVRSAVAAAALPRGESRAQPAVVDGGSHQPNGKHGRK